MVMTVLGLILLLGFVALAVDVGALFHAKRNLQVVADAAATAGALDYYRNGAVSTATTSARTAAENAIAANGLSGVTYSTTCPVTGSLTGTNACISIPAVTGFHTGDGSVEVQISQPNATSFMGLFGHGMVGVLTRAVAGNVAGVSCMYVNNNLNVQGNAAICGVDPDNISSWNGSCGTGNTCGTATPTACGIYAGGNITGTGGGGGSNCIDTAYVETAGTVGVPVNPSPAVGGTSMTVPDTLSIAPPAIPSGCKAPSTSTPGVTYVAAKGNSPATYTWNLTGSISAGCYGWPGAFPANTILNVNLNNATMGNGLYQFNLGTITTGKSAGTAGTLTVGSNVTGGSSADNSSSGVTLELNTGNFGLDPNASNIELYAPSDGVQSASAGQAQSGYILWAPSTNMGNVSIQIGSSGSPCSNFVGYIVMPGANLTMQDQGSCALVTGLYVNNFSINSQLGIVNYNDVYTHGPLRTITLTE